jgi:hypothetical protein
VSLARIERVYESGLPEVGHARKGGHVTVHLERAKLTDGVPVMYLVQGEQVKAAYDPDQTEEAAALAWLCIRIPRLVRDGFEVYATI